MSRILSRRHKWYHGVLIPTPKCPGLIITMEGQNIIMKLIMMGKWGIPGWGVFFNIQKGRWSSSTAFYGCYPSRFLPIILIMCQKNMPINSGKETYLYKESIMYADYSPEQNSSNSAKKMPWYKNTLFVITADHTSEGYYPYYQTDAGQYAIPILFFQAGWTAGWKKRGDRLSNRYHAFGTWLPWTLTKDYIGLWQQCFWYNFTTFFGHYISGIYGVG